MSSIQIGDYVVCKLDRRCRGFVKDFGKVGNQTVLIGENDSYSKWKGQTFSGQKQYFAKRKPPKEKGGSIKKEKPKQITIYDYT